MPAAKKAKVIVLKSEPLSEGEIKEALGGNGQSLWYRALMQKIEDHKSTWANSQHTAASTGNQLSLSFSAGALYALLAIQDLFEQRE